MKRLKLSFAMGILTVAFAVSTAIAGQMPCGVTSSSPTPTETSATGDMPNGTTEQSSSSEASVTGEMPMGITSGIDPVTEFTLGLLQGVLALF